jgi:ABC-type antimicrobial peptide transport system permease subunit
LIPEAPYSGFFQDEVFAAFYQEGEGVKKIFSFMAFIALIISCMGLFGLVSIHVTRRMKEIGIRKVLGASIAQVSNLINREFVFVIVIAIMLAAPLSYFAIYGMLNALYEYRVDAGVLPFALAAVLIFLTAGLTISTQVYKAATANPAAVLRSE